MISVIVTVYNKEPYIRRCIKSIENNTYKDVEIIIVEDCSTDNSMTIIQELMSEYDNIILIKNEVNQGAGYSRNVGIKAAKGEWISLIDSDDWIDEDYFQTYLDNIEDDVDIIFGECKIILPSKKIIDGFKRKKNCSLIIDEEVIYNLSVYNLQFINLSLIKTKLFENVEYCKERLIEDTPTCYMLLMNCKKIQFIKYNGYNYVQLSSSLIHSNTKLLQSLYFLYNMIDTIDYIESINTDLSIIIKEKMSLFFYKIFVKFNVTINDVYNNFEKNKLDKMFKFYKMNVEKINHSYKKCTFSKFEYIEK